MRAIVATGAIVIVLTIALYASVAKFPGGWRVAQAPSRALERTIPADRAGRIADDSRIIVR